MQNNSFTKNLMTGIRKRLKLLSDNPYKQVNINWLKLKYYKHLAPGKLRKHTMFGSDVYFLSPGELLHGLEEIFIDNIYKQQLKESPYIIDCGANIGLSIIYIKQAYPKAEILAFEPDEKNFSLLSKNMESFGLSNITLRNEAVWVENTKLKFFNDGSMGSKIDDENSNTSHEVQAIRLKDLLVKDIDFLKIDIEGAEFKVLSDLGNNLHFVKNLFVEYHGSYQQNTELTKLFEIFSENGFSYYIKEATEVYATPFLKIKKSGIPYDVQLNIFCFRL